MARLGETVEENKLTTLGQCNRDRPANRGEGHQRLKRRMHADDDCAECKQKDMLLEAKDAEIAEKDLELEALDWAETLRAQLARTRAQLRAASAASVPAAALDGKAIAVKERVESTLYEPFLRSEKVKADYLFNKVKRSTFSLAEFLKDSKYYDNKKLARKDLEDALAAGQAALISKALIWTSRWASVEEDLVTDLTIEKCTKGRTAIAAEQVLKRKPNESEQDHAPTTQIKRIRTTSTNPPRAALTLSVDGKLNNAISGKPASFASGVSWHSTHQGMPAIARAPNGLPSRAKQTFEEYREDALQFASLANLPACQGILVELLSAKERWETRDDKLWNHPGIPGDAGADDKLFWKMLRGSLWHAWKESMPDTSGAREPQTIGLDRSCHRLVLATPTGQAYVLALVRVQVHARTVARPTQTAAVSTKYRDALGSTSTTRKEWLLMEASLGLDKEMAGNKNASTASMTKLMVMTVQAVQEARSCHTLAWKAEGK
ncbi:hypothetical protein HDU90_006985 [Geranomyces variabilis]|nr:hypothetical protein HDU90_006985 [Geranomyces variabilis]